METKNNRYYVGHSETWNGKMKVYRIAASDEETAIKKAKERYKIVEINYIERIN